MQVCLATVVLQPEKVMMWLLLTCVETRSQGLDLPAQLSLIQTQNCKEIVMEKVLRYSLPFFFVNHAKHSSASRLKMEGVGRLCPILCFFARSPTIFD